MYIGDSILIICQVKGKGQTKEIKFTHLNTYLNWLENEEIKFTHLGKEGNHFDVLVTPASMARIDFGHKVQPTHIDIRNNLAHCCSIRKRSGWKPVVL